MGSDPCAVTALLETTNTNSVGPPDDSLLDKVNELIESGDLSTFKTVLPSMLDHDEHIE